MIFNKWNKGVGTFEPVIMKLRKGFDKHRIVIMYKAYFSIFP